MKFTQHNLYYIFNQSNNNPLFFNNENYIYFLKKVRKHFLPFCDILNYTLLPDSFHFLVHIKPEPTVIKREFDVKEKQYDEHIMVSKKERHPLAVSIGYMLSAYTQAINIQNNTTGSLFTQKTKGLLIESKEEATTCFYYIHQLCLNNAASKIELWDFCSFKDYIGQRNGTLCNKQLAFEKLIINQENFYTNSYQLLYPSQINLFTTNKPSARHKRSAGVSV